MDCLRDPSTLRKMRVPIIIINQISSLFVIIKSASLDVAVVFSPSNIDDFKAIKIGRFSKIICLVLYEWTNFSFRRSQQYLAVKVGMR